MTAVPARRRPRLVVAATALAVLTLGALPDLASAHGLVGKQDLPVPRWLFAWAAAAVLVISFVGLATLWPSPRLQHPRERIVARIPRFLDPLAGAFGVFVFVVVVYAGLAGTQSPTANLAPTFVFVVFWVGLPFVSAVFGDFFKAVNPWRAIARFVRWCAARIGAEAPAPFAYPAWLGRWPAAAGILAFAWVELVYVNKDDPSKLAILAVAYAAIQLVGMSLYGIETWLDRADAYGVYFGLFAKLSPLHWRRGEVAVRRPLEGVVGLDPVPGTVALLCTMIGTTSFDGFSQGPLWTSIAPHLQSLFQDVGLSAEPALEAGYTVGLLCVVAIIGCLYRIGVVGMRTVGEGRDPSELARVFVHSLVPIALAYVVAHYFSLLAYQGQAAVALASDPLGHGSNILGTAGITIDYNVIGATGVWYVQVVALVCGHAAGLALAHDRALAMYRAPQDATRSQYWMLAVMVAFTSLGLWLLSAANS
jgi:hypothetical protein